MLDRLRRAFLSLSVSADKHATQRDLRRLTGLAAGLVRRPDLMQERLAGLDLVMRQHEDETSTWVPAEAIAAGQGGAFDACDLRHWLALAERAGVPFVPAKEILRLSEEEMALASGSVEMPDNATTRGIRRRAAKLGWPKADGSPEDAAPEVNAAELEERLASAMDGVPEGWMVRSARCGSSELKTLAGVGVAGPTVPEVRFGPDLEIGPGWVRRGNRRHVWAADRRTVEQAASGPPGGTAFLARPWIEAARFAVGEDPHRHGTAYAGKGMWPAEWRAFVEGGRVTGVASYYGWCGSATPENAVMALEVRDLAQRIADEAAAQRAWPRYMDLEFVRLSEALKDDPAARAACSRFGRDDVACTLDFIETREGLMLLEGGPPNTPYGGGHPTAFAGCGGRPTPGNPTATEGVAFRVMPHVLLADPSTWTDGDRSGCILSWDETAELAASASPKP